MTSKIAMPMRLILGLAACTLAGCFLSTPYQPDGLGGGYSNSRIDSSTMHVSFRSNDRTPMRTVELFMLYRCAQVTRDAGYNYFVLVNPATGTADLSPGAGRMAMAADASIATRQSYFPDNTLDFDQEGAHATIKMFPGKAPANVPAAYDASEVITDLTPAIDGEVSLAQQSAPMRSAEAAHVYRGSIKDYLEDEP